MEDLIEQLQSSLESVEQPTRHEAHQYRRRRLRRIRFYSHQDQLLGGCVLELPWKSFHPELSPGAAEFDSTDSWRLKHQPQVSLMFAALVVVVNNKFPQIGDLLLRRTVLQLRRAYKRNDKPQLIAAVKFVAHLVNQMVAYELIDLELLTLLLDQPPDDSVEVAVCFVTECGAILQDLSPKGLHEEYGHTVEACTFFCARN